MTKTTNASTTAVITTTKAYNDHDYVTKAYNDHDYVY